MPIKKERPAAITGDPTMGLTDKQRAFIDNVLRGMPQTLAARTAGYANAPVEGNRMMKNPKIREALQILHYKHEKASQMTRKKVMDGMLEAIDMARIQGESGVMVAGWREIGRMCGYYAAEKKVIDINITAKRAVDKLEMLSDAELLEMIDKDSDAIEGEFTEVLEATQQTADAQYAAAGYE
jgi:phage terminase small subunit